jgi:phosphoadenosine phosphosulfate reductase
MIALLEIDFVSAQRDLAGDSGEAVIDWVVDRFGVQSVALACSFGAEDVVLVDIIARHHRNLPIFVLDTGRLHQETYDVMDRCRERYGLDFEIYNPQTIPLQAMLRERGPNSFYRSVDDRKTCCEIRKVEPLRRALAGREAWITGLRREQSVTRTSLAKIERDDAHGGIAKLNPLADWTEERVWEYIRAHDVPYNALHDRGFPSIGCAPCTRAIHPGEDVRAGRWWWESPEHKECGLHLKVRSAS